MKKMLLVLLLVGVVLAEAAYMGPGECGNTLCEPEFEETIESCPEDCGLDALNQTQDKKEPELIYPMIGAAIVIILGAVVAFSMTR